MNYTFNVRLQSDTGPKALQYKVSTRDLRPSLLRQLLRKRSILERENSLMIAHSIPSKTITRIALQEVLSERITETVIRHFLRQIATFSEFMGSCDIKWGYTPEAQYRKCRIYLHKVHKIAPVFDYKRARVNLGALQAFYDRTVRSPRISTLLALTIFIADRKRQCETKINEKLKFLLKSNIRAITHCSAYAFYGNLNFLYEKGVIERDE